MNQKIILLLLACFCAMPFVFSEGQEELDYLNNHRAYALKLFKQVASDNRDTNIALSPLAIAQALQMVYGGAKKNTEKELYKLLYPVDYNKRLGHKNVHDFLGKSINKIQSYENFSLSVASNAWTANDFEPLETYQKLLKESYQAELESLDFNNAERAANTINDWAKTKSNDAIQELVQPALFNANTKLVIANAFGFKSSWRYPFEKNSTGKGKFTLQNKETVEVDYLTSFDLEVGYYENEKAQIIELPLEEPNLVFYAVLPKKEFSLNQIEQGLEVSKLKILSWMLQKTKIKLLKLPVVNTKFDLSLKSTLEKLNVKDAFNPGVADFTGISAEKGLYISDIMSSNAIQWTEKELVAYSQTAVVFATRGLPRFSPEGIEVLLDRPFIYLVLDKSQDIVLEVGHIVNPLK